MSLDVPTALLERAETGSVTDAEFVDCVRQSLPYAWTVISQVAADRAAGNADFADHEIPPPGEKERGQLLRALASDAIRGGLERHFGVKLAFQNCHRVAAFRPSAVGGERYQAFISPRGQLLISRRSFVTADPGRDGGRLPPAPVRIDVFLLAGQFPGVSAGQALRHAVDYAVAAEHVGFDGVWIAEHHFIPYGACPSALAFAGHLLGRTSRIRVGTAACILSNRHPVAVAEEAAMLDQMSAGRLDLGVTRGGPWIDLEVFGTGLDRFHHGFAESLDLLLAWLSGKDTVGADGAFFRFPPVAVIPRPDRPVPVYVAATGTATAAPPSRRKKAPPKAVTGPTSRESTMMDASRHRPWADVCHGGHS